MYPMIPFPAFSLSYLLLSNVPKLALSPSGEALLGKRRIASFCGGFCSHIPQTHKLSGSFTTEGNQILRVLRHLPVPLPTASAVDASTDQNPAAQTDLEVHVLGLFSALLRSVDGLGSLPRLIGLPLPSPYLRSQSLSCWFRAQWPDLPPSNPFLRPDALLLTNTLR